MKRRYSFFDRDSSIPAYILFTTKNLYVLDAATLQISHTLPVTDIKGKGERGKGEKGRERKVEGKKKRIEVEGEEGRCKGEGQKPDTLQHYGTRSIQGEKKGQK